MNLEQLKQEIASLKPDEVQRNSLIKLTQLYVQQSKNTQLLQSILTALSLIFALQCILIIAWLLIGVSVAERL